MPWQPHFPHTLCVKQSLLGLFLPSNPVLPCSGHHPAEVFQVTFLQASQQQVNRRITYSAPWDVPSGSVLQGADAFGKVNSPLESISHPHLTETVNP